MQEGGRRQVGERRREAGGRRKAAAMLYSKRVPNHRWVGKNKLLGELGVRKSTQKTSFLEKAFLLDFRPSGRPCWLDVWRILEGFGPLLPGAVLQRRSPASCCKKTPQASFCLPRGFRFQEFGKEPEKKNKLSFAGHFWYKIHSKTECCRQGGQKDVFETPGKRFLRGTWRHVEP